MQTQGFSHKNSPRSEKSKNKDSKPALPHGNMAEPVKKKNKKKRLQRHKKEWNKQTPGIDDNTEALKKKKRGVAPARPRI